MGDRIASRGAGRNADELRAIADGEVGRLLRAVTVQASSVFHAAVYSQ
jgi:hypothetical protein